jgi:hypothetical protein
MRSLTGLGLIVLIFMIIFGLAMTSMMTGMMRASAPSTILMDMQTIKPKIESACNKPAGISQIGSENVSASYDIEFIQAPVYPNQFNCLTCSDMAIRATTRTAIGLAMAWAEYRSIYKSFTKKGATEGLDIVDDIAAEWSDDALKQVLKAPVREALEGSVDDVAKVLGKEAAEEIAEETSEQLAKTMAKKISQETLDTLAKKPGILAKVWKGIKYPVSAGICGVGGFVSMYTRGVEGSLRTGLRHGSSGNGVCGVAYVAGAGVAGAILAESFVENINYVQNDINRLTEMLLAVEDHFETMESVLNGTNTEVPISMDQSLFVSHQHPNFASFQSLALEGFQISSDIIVKTGQVNDILYNILYNKLEDYPYAEYYFSSSAEGVRSSNTFWAGELEVTSPDFTTVEKVNVVRIRPPHMSAIVANSRMFLERRTEKYPVLHARIVQRYDRLYENYRYMPIEHFIYFLEMLDVDSWDIETIDPIDIPVVEEFFDPTLVFVPEYETSVLGDLEALESADPSWPRGKVTTRQMIREIIDDLKRVEAATKQVEQNQIQLLSIQNRAWALLSAESCNAEPLMIGDLEIIKSTCAAVVNCNWDYVRDYSFFAGESLELGDCVALAVIVNEPVAHDPLTGDQIWRTIPAFRMDKQLVEQLLGMMTMAMNRGIIRPTERIAAGITFGTVGRMIGSWTDAGQYCPGAYFGDASVMMCCVEVADCRIGLCRLCDTVRCARSINLEPRLQPGIIVDTAQASEIKIIGNIGILS